MKTGKWLLFAFTATALSTIVVIGAILAVDLYLHKRFEPYSAVNYRGYRGKVVGRKQPDEQRVVVLGGSTALGYGVGPDESFPAYLERQLTERRRQAGEGPVTVVNLAYNNQGAYSFQFTLRDFEYLGYDAAILYEGYNDFGSAQNTYVFRRDSPVYMLTGYYPIFPLIFKEKAMAIRHGGNLEAAYWGRKTVFTPNLAQRATASSLEAAVRISDSFQHQLGRLTQERARSVGTTLTEGCEGAWRTYCQSVYSAVSYAVSRGTGVIVATQPYASEAHRQQQEAMAAMLRSKFGQEPRVAYVNLGEGVVDLHDRSICFDGAHLLGPGNERIAERLVEPVRQLFAELRGLPRETAQRGR